MKSAEIPTKSADGSVADQEVLDYVEEEDEEEKVGIADPLEPFNRAMYHFNDKLYFWVLKPVAQGYRKVVPEEARVGVGNFFANITFPIRFVNCLLQANFRGAASELGRFVINTHLGYRGTSGYCIPSSHQSLQTGRGFRSNPGSLRIGTGILHQLADIGAFQPSGYIRVGW